MARASVLTSGLEGLAEKSPAIARLLTELFALDDELQDAHRAAKADDENGERVVQAYQAFLSRRKKLIQELERERIAVPWQLRMRIDDIELTLRQRKDKQATAATAKPKTPAATAAKQEKEENEDKDDPLLLLKALILPTALLAVLAGVIYSAASFAT